MTPTDALRRLALAATPGPWHEIERCDNTQPDEACGVTSEQRTAHGHIIGIFQSDAYDECSHPVSAANAAFIAAADPTTVVALLDQLAALRAALSEARDEIENGTCARHAGQQHGLEAEELRHGVEDILRNTDWKDMRAELQRLLDETDARDSLAYLERRDEQLAEAKALGLEACRVANVALGRLSHIEHPADWYADTERVNEIRARLEGK
jgi:hypothetical protein